MRTAAPALLPLFRSELQVELMALVLLQPDRGWTLDQLTNTLGASVSSVHRELGRLVDAGLAIRDTSQRPHRFTAATSSPAYEPLKQLLDLTAGVPARLGQALQDLGNVRAAAIHGSWAAGRVRPDSDIDVLVVSDGDRREVRRAVRAVVRAAGRDADPSILDLAELERLTRVRNPFLAKIVDGPRIDVVGDVASLTATS